MASAFACCPPVVLGAVNPAALLAYQYAYELAVQNVSARFRERVFKSSPN